MKTKTDAVLELLDNASINTLTLSSYKRAIKACKILGILECEAIPILQKLEYANCDGKLYEWLEDKLSGKQEEAKQ